MEHLYHDFDLLPMIVGDGHYDVALGHDDSPLFSGDDSDVSCD